MCCLLAAMAEILNFIDSEIEKSSLTKKQMSQNVDFNKELKRVIIHGVLHYCGHRDATKEDKRKMRSLEDKYLDLL